MARTPSTALMVNVGPGHLGSDGHKCELEAPEAGLLSQQDGAEPLLLDETTRHWGQSIVFAPVNLTTISPSSYVWVPKCFSYNSVEEPYFYWQHCQWMDNHLEF